jgi:hypothetical protein
MFSSSTFVCVVAAACLFMVVYYVAEKWNSDLVLVTSTVDQRPYTVRNLPDKQQAADMLANARAKFETLVEKLQQHYPADKRVQLLASRFRPSAISEIAGNADAKYTSYSVSKGEKIVFCLRSRDAHQKLITLQTLMFVAIHELAHVMTVSVGHTEEFWNNMRFLLANAIVWRVYRPINYGNNPEPYCGLHITSSPLGPKCAELRKFVTYKEAEEVELKYDDTNEACVVAAA